MGRKKEMIRLKPIPRMRNEKIILILMCHAGIMTFSNFFILQSYKLKLQIFKQL